MAETLVINSSGKSYYGWASDHTALAATSMFVGRWYNGDHTRTYDSVVLFVPPSEPVWGSNPIVVNAVRLYTKDKQGSPYNAGMNIYLSTGQTPTAFTKLPDEVIGHLTGTNVSITSTAALAQIAIYLQEKTTFCFHIGANVAGGSIHGYNPDTSSYRPRIEIDWEYAETDGTLGRTFYNVGETATLTANVRGTGYTHDIKWYVNNINIKNETFSNWTTPGTRTVSCSLNPSNTQIDQWFSTTSPTATGYAQIITKKGTTQIGQTRTVHFTLTLTSSYCVSNSYLKPNGITFTNASDNNTGMGYIAGRSKITISGAIAKNGNATYSATLRVDGGLLEPSKSQTNTASPVNISNLVIGSSSLQATLTITDSRGLIYTQNSASTSPRYYDEIAFQSVDFYRSNGTNETPLGTKIGCSFRVSTSYSGNTITEVYVKSGSTLSTKAYPNTASHTYTSTNLFSGLTFSAETSHTFEIWVKDKITSNSSLNGYSNYNSGYRVYSITVPKAEYIIHIPKGGNGIAFGAASAGDGTVELGWPLKGKVFEANKTVSIYGTNVSSLDGLKNLILNNSSLSNYVPKDTAFTGNIKLNTSKIINNSNRDMLKYDSRVYLGNTSDALTIYGNGQIKSNDNSTVLRSGKEVLISSTTPTGTIDAGTIWLKIL